MGRSCLFQELVGVVTKDTTVRKGKGSSGYLLSVTASAVDFSAGICHDPLQEHVTVFRRGADQVDVARTLYHHDIPAQVW